VNPPSLSRLQRALQQQPLAAGSDLVVEGPAYPQTVKALATVLMLTLVLWGAMALAEPNGPLPGPEGWAFLCAAAGVVLFGYWGILSARTRIDGRCITQSGPWRKHVALIDVTQVKLVCVPGLSWLIVPRLVVRTGYGLTSFRAGDPAVLAQFRRLAYGDPPTDPE